jgi:ABC-type glycerol-3-phosphate transport system substrate-binding protein
LALAGWTAGRAALPRRSVLRGAAAAVAAGAGAVLAACAAGGRRPQTSAVSTKVTLVLQPNGTLPFNRTLQAVYQQALEPFYAAHPGVEVRLAEPLWGGNVQAILEGTAADVISDNYPPPYMSPFGNLLLPLDDYLKADNIDLSRWSAGQIRSYYQAAPDGSLYMLPGYFSPLIYVVRLDDFAEAGLARPDPAWTHEEFARLCRRLTRVRPDGSRRYGAVVEWNSTILGEATWPFFAFGTGAQDTQGRAILSSPANIRAGRFLYEELFWPGWATTRDLLGPWYNTDEVVADRVSMQLCWDGLVLDNVQRFVHFAWDYYPPPVFPQGPTCMGTDDFYAIAATTQHPDLAWALLKFLTYEDGPRGWQRSMMKAALLQPSLNALWDEWIATVRAAAPLLGDKHLEHFRDMAVTGRAFPEQYWRFADRGCQSLTVPHMRDLWQRKVDVPTAFAAMDREINALLAQAAAAARDQARAAAAIAAVVPGPGNPYPPPARSGAGLPAAPADPYVVHDQAAGAWTLLGVGDDVGAAADSCTFAALAVPDSVGEWTCRVRAVANVSCARSGQPVVSPWLKVGLMARADLSDDAPFVSIHLTGDHGLEVQTRAIPGVAPSAMSGLGLRDARGQRATLTAPPGAPTPNYLLAPVWLRMRRQGRTWTLWASLDGKSWQRMGPPQSCKGMGGAWIGLVCCAHNADFDDRGYIRAVFDNLSFTPAEAVIVGVIGVPPAGGPVPADWAKG